MRMMTALPVFLAISGVAHAEDVGLKLWRLDCGIIQVNDLNAFSDDFSYVGQSKVLTDSCYLIQHGDDYMLWDTGLPKLMLNAPLDKATAMSPTLKTTVVDQLKEIGVDPASISRVGISHNHFDHVGQAADFADATLIINKADYEAFKIVPSPFGVDKSLIAPWLPDGAKLDPIEGDKDVFGDGSVVILATPGHTPGSQSLLVRLNKTGPVILSGDTVHFEEQFANDGVPPFNINRAESLASMKRLESIATNLKAVLVVQHDAGDIAKLPPFPKAAE